MPGWKTGTKALCLYKVNPHRPASLDLLDNSLNGVECTANLPGSGSVADIVIYNAPVEYSSVVLVIL